MKGKKTCRPTDIHQSSNFCIDRVHEDRARVPTQLTRHNNIFMRVFLVPSTRRLHPTIPSFFYSHPSSLRLLPPHLSPLFHPPFLLFPFSLFSSFFLFSFSFFLFSPFLPLFLSSLFVPFFSFLSFIFLFLFSFLSLPSLFSLPLFSFFPTAAQFYRQYPDRWGGVSHPPPPLETPLSSTYEKRMWKSHLCPCNGGTN